MEKLKIDYAGRYYSTCILKNGKERNFQENPCPDAWAGCDGSCNKFKVLLKNGEFIGGENADKLIKEFWKNF